MMSSATVSLTNPFATRWTKPGAIQFDFGGRATIDDLVQRLAQRNWRGAIVGPHGSGKSTLLAMLLPALEASGRKSMLVRLHNGQRQLPVSYRHFERLGPTSIVVIDGYEQLGHMPRWRLSRQCRRHGYGLLVTSHRRCGLPELFRTEPDLALVEQLIDRSLPPHAGLISRMDIQHAWRRHAGNVREVLFELYDVFEARRRL
jgi:energy-coupling factor transporter ATP-binding protein EcfA2